MADERVSEAERGAQQGLEAKGGAELARALLREERAAVLATALAPSGHPFASLVLFALSREGEPLLLLSALAQHTRNLGADPRACLFLHDASAAAKDPRTAARAAILGRVKRVPPADEEDARARYLARHPSARGLMNLDFALHVLAVEEAQIVGGFAAAGWVSGADLRKPEP
ncbi:MAG TPA: pyridoxamine 5'-phosphate oxidase family protein [Anaeromyxobacter sp.]